MGTGQVRDMLMRCMVVMSNSQARLVLGWLTDVNECRQKQRVLPGSSARVRYMDSGIAILEKSAHVWMSLCGIMLKALIVGFPDDRTGKRLAVYASGLMERSAKMHNSGQIDQVLTW